MSSAMISQTVQGMILSITSNIIAQMLTSYKDNTPFQLNMASVLKFALFSMLSNPPNIIWQTFLEEQLPTSVPTKAIAGPDSKKRPSKKSIATRTSKRNILIKFLLDQTIGAFVNTLLFLAFMGYVNAQGKQGVDAWSVVVSDCLDTTWPMMKDGYKFWPIVSLISFVWVPVDKRVVFGCSVGLFWGIYLSLKLGA